MTMWTNGTDHSPVLKLFSPDAAATWLIAKVDPEVKTAIWHVRSRPRLARTRLSQFVRGHGWF
jgi:hypothetical protein